MKLDQYKYESGGVKLEFSFEKGENSIEQKKIFINLMHQAIKELHDEVGGNHGGGGFHNNKEILI